MPFVPKRNLPRLDPVCYRGYSDVFWTLTLEHRDRGWLNPEFHFRFREIMTHAAYRFHLWCPVYCLMPDHVHLLWMGISRASDQLPAMRFLRAELEPCLGNGRRWQHQSHDHVLRKEERHRTAFARICEYLLANPVRAELVSAADQWRFHGSILPGYPSLHPLEPDFWPLFWKLYCQHRNQESQTQARPSSSS